MNEAPAFYALAVPAVVLLGLAKGGFVGMGALSLVAIASTIAGVWLVRRVPAERFYTANYGLMVLVGAKLMWDAAG